MEKKYPLRKLSNLSYSTLTDTELPAICVTQWELLSCVNNMAQYCCDPYVIPYYTIFANSFSSNTGWSSTENP